ncbi:MAG TPA: efflux RND transporter periplasmic adaptor subunit [Vicinamibacterales bacterium]|nr:efflux RND transporter periplasmic adaptor subunit [Vicinamibacterales bacterium]
MISRRSIVALVVVIAAAVAGARLLSRDSGIEVTAAPVERVPLLQSSVTASGEIVAARYAEIGSNVMGRIVELSIKEGDRVTAGQTLARIDPVQAEAGADAANAALSALAADAQAAASQVRSAQAGLEEARSRAAEAATALTRAQQLREAGLLPGAEFDRVEAAAIAARAQESSAAAAVDKARQAAAATEQRVAQGRAERSRARDQLSKTAITAPIAGTVSRLDVELGEMVVVGVQNQPGTILMVISDLNTINAEVKVAEADVMRLKTGMTATVTLEAVAGQKFPGRVVEIGASALPQIGTQAAAREFRVKVQLDQAPPSLRPGLTCDADIAAAEKRNVLTVPLQAVVQRNGVDGAFQIVDGVARFVPVTTGIIGGLVVEVDGLAEQSQVVSGPIQALRTLQDGIAVTVATPR